VRYIEGRLQVATSRVTEDLTLLGGAVRLEGMRWTARRIVGASETRRTTFSFGRVLIGGVPLEAPNSTPDATINAINTVLAPAGLSVRKPVRSTNRHTGAVAIGPFVLRFSGSSPERTIFKPVTDAFITLENVATSLGSQGDDCTKVRQLISNVFNNNVTLVHVALAIAQGAGALDLQFGGVAAGAQNPPSYTNPFATGDLPSAPPGIGLGGTGAGSRRPISQPTSAALAGTGSASEIPPTVAVAAQRCVSTSPSRAHSCWHGLATVAAGGALAVGIALLITDVVVTRRRRIAAVPVNPRSAETSA
jgi:hypothetical protein